MTIDRRMLVCAMALLSTLAVAADSVPLKPGRWIETAVADGVTMAGKAVALPAEQPRSKSVCLTAAEAADPKLYFATVKEKDRCGVPTGDVAAGKIALIGTCTNDGTPRTSSQIVIDGTYGGERYAATARMTTDMDGTPMVVTMKIDGRYEGACRGDEERRPEGKS